MADQTFTDKNFQSEVIESKSPVLVDFWAPWCAPCRMVSPIIEELANEYEGKVLIGKMNADENPETVGQIGVMSLPTIMFFKNGKPVKTLIGAHGKESYKKAIDEILS
jgi:thioredoxin 1